MEIINKYSAGGVVIKGEEVLTLHVPDPDKTIFPKGTIEVGESPQATALREVLEETGYHTEILAPIGNTSYKFEKDGKLLLKKVHYFLMRLADVNEISNPKREDGEKFDNQWLKIEQAKIKLTYEIDKDLFEKALKILSSERG